METPDIRRFQPQIEALIQTSAWAFEQGLLSAEEMERAILDELNRLVIGDLVRQGLQDLNRRLIEAHQRRIG